MKHYRFGLCLLVSAAFFIGLDVGREAFTVLSAAGLLTAITLLWDLWSYYPPRAEIRRVLNWARGCVPYESACHTAIINLINKMDDR